jgi:uncharacterized protein YecE (DUF72 family)
MMFRSSASEVAQGLKSRSSPTSQLWIGTCGYSYVEWADAGFYPRGTKPAHMLRFYTKSFSVTELNHTWYQMPRAEAIERQRQRAHPGFHFAAKLTRTLTHEVDPDGWREQAAAFRTGIAPLIQTGQLIAVLVQLPNAFGHTHANRRHLALLLDELRGLPLAVEFRNVGWALDRVYAELERRRVSLVTVDEPDLPGLFPALDVVTNPELIYMRFHGRNGKAWYSGRKESQFDYDYADDELRGWVDKTLEPMARQARRGVVFFNNHVAAQAPRNARTLIRLLRQRGFAVMA